MKYRLKNQDLQRRLEEFLGKEFVEEALIKGDVDNYILTIYADLGDGSYVDIGIHIDDIKEIEEYDPDGWNNFPAVTPPEGVPMRCITQTGMGFMLQYMDGDWLDNRNDIYDENGLA